MFHISARITDRPVKSDRVENSANSSATRIARHRRNPHSSGNFTFFSLENGNYWLYARDSTGNISEPQTFTIEGVRIDNNLSRRFRIYPNPMEDHLIIETKDVSDLVLELTSPNGQIVYTSVVEGDSHQIDLASFQKGVYFITISSKDFVTTEKIIKL